MEKVNHPAHYGGADNVYEAIKVIEAWKLNFNLGNTIKYISRAGKKEQPVPIMERQSNLTNINIDIVKENKIQDLKKAMWYLNREIENLEKL